MIQTVPTAFISSKLGQSQMFDIFTNYVLSTDCKWFHNYKGGEDWSEFALPIPKWLKKSITFFSFVE